MEPALSAPHRRYVLIDNGIGSGVFNFVLNGAIAYLMFRSLEDVPLWGQQSIAGDTLGTLFFLPFFTCLIVTRLTQGQLRSGKLPPMMWRRESHPTLGRLPRGTFLRSVVLGIGAVLVAGPLSVWALGAVGIEHMSFWGFVAFKATFAAFLAVIFTPLIALCALGDGHAVAAPGT
jgi:hypothetical protein